MSNAEIEQRQSGAPVLAYLIPEFPGQTHNFFWREIRAIEERGARVHLFSTRRPPAGLASTHWHDEGVARTRYLFPPSARDMLRVTSWALTHPKALWRLIGEIRAAEVPASARRRLVPLAALGVLLGLEMHARGVLHVHVHSCADAAQLALFAHVATDVSYSLTLHNPVSVYGPNQDRKWGSARFGVVIARWVLADLQQHHGPALPAHLALAPMGVEMARFQRGRAWQSPLDGQPLRLFCCARLNRAKGYEDLIEAVGRLTRSGRAVTLTVAGTDDEGGTGYARVLQRRVEELGLARVVTFLGGVSEERVHAELEQAHLFVLASHEEPLGVAIMEAMAMEVPVLATAAGGVPEIITDGENGWLVAPRDPPALAEAIARLAALPASELTRVARAGRDRIAQGFGHERSAHAILNAMAQTRGPGFAAVDSGKQHVD